MHSIESFTDYISKTGNRALLILQQDTANHHYRNIHLVFLNNNRPARYPSPSQTAAFRIKEIGHQCTPEGIGCGVDVGPTTRKRPTESITSRSIQTTRSNDGRSPSGSA